MDEVITCVEPDSDFAALTTSDTGGCVGGAFQADRTFPVWGKLQILGSQRAMLLERNLEEDAGKTIVRGSHDVDPY